MLQDTTDSSTKDSLIEALLTNDRFLVFVTDPFGKVIQSGAGVERLLGYTSDEICGKIFHALLCDPLEIKRRAVTLNREQGRFLEPGFDVVTNAAKTGETEEHVWTLIRKDTSRVPIQLTSRAYNSDGSTHGYVFIGRSANNLLVLKQQLSEMQTKLTVANAKLAALSVTDELTGLKNRQAYKENLEREFRRAIRHHTTMSVILVSIDHFKSYNEDFGTAAGDKGLKMFADALLKGTRSTDYLARYDGVVFAYILPETDREGAMIKANRIQDDLQNYGWANRQLTASLGVATLGSESPAVQGITSSSTLMDRALNALDKSQSLGGALVTHFDDPISGNIESTDQV
ncbi:MAG: diguanylate cyclase [Pseudomonadota bacterium]